jgi:tetratricopeptide (TPR) repeat protein
MPRCQSLASFLLITLLTFVCVASFAQAPLARTSLLADQVQVSRPQIGVIEPPSADETPQVLERKGDDLRATKDYLDALDYYKAALAKKPNDPDLYNKMGISELLMQRWPDAKKSFERAIKADHKHADAYNNLGVIYYISKKYGKAIDRYNKAIELREDTASYYSNLGAALFSKKEFDKSATAYSHALELDPDVFERTSKAGVSAQMSKPEDRAHYDYVVAKLYAKMGIADRSLEYLRKALEEGYKSIKNVYKEPEFAGIRKDPRFNELMAARLPAIPD